MQRMIASVATVLCRSACKKHAIVILNEAIPLDAEYEIRIPRLCFMLWMKHISSQPCDQRLRFGGLVNRCLVGWDRVDISDIDRSFCKISTYMHSDYYYSSIYRPKRKGYCIVRGTVKYFGASIVIRRFKR